MTRQLFVSKLKFVMTETHFSCSIHSWLLQLNHALIAYTVFEQLYFGEEWIWSF